MAAVAQQFAALAGPIEACHRSLACDPAWLQDVDLVDLDTAPAASFIDPLSTAAETLAEQTERLALACQ